MRKARIAEWILELVLRRERAASTVGDLIEEAGARGASWFWVNIAGTFVSAVWGQFRAEPWRGAALGLLGYAFGFAISLLIIFVESQIIPLPSWQWQAAQHANSVSVSLLIGFWIAHLAKGREFSASLAVLGVALIFMAALNLHLRGPVGFHAVGFAEFCLALFAGPVMARRRRAPLP
jgi:hypothetical protein